MTEPLPSIDQARPRIAPVAIAAAVLAALGALLCGVITFGLALAGVDLPTLRMLFAGPVAPLPPRPFALIATLVGLIVLVAVVLLITAAVARAADRRRGFAAVLFGSWLAVVVGGWLAALAAAPVTMIDLRVPSGELYGQLILQRVGSGGGWGLYWGWLTGLVGALVFGAVNRRS